MAQYEYHAAPDGPGFVVDVQAGAMDHLNLRVVVPLLPSDAAPLPQRTLNPVFDIDGTPHVFLTHYLSAVPIGVLGTVQGSLGDQDYAITRALDLLFHGI